MEFNITQAINENLHMLAVAEDMDVAELTRQLMSVGFECTRCGECCRSRLGDNCVIVFPDEVLPIMEAQNLGWDDVCKPSTPQFIDNSKTLHSFEWELNRHSNGACTFLNEDNTCSIYSCRPWICRTYPFYLGFKDNRSTPMLNISECEGVGNRVFSKDDARELASVLKARLISEIHEEIQLLEHLEGYEDWRLYEEDVYTGNGVEHNMAVHDGRGFTVVWRYVK